MGNDQQQSSAVIFASSMSACCERDAVVGLKMCVVLEMLRCYMLKIIC